MQAFGNDEKKIRDYIKKMMGRITFLHFLQRKGWMCGDLNYMQNLFQRSSHQDDYLDYVLEPLFFGILNTKPEEREAVFDDYLWDKSLLTEWNEIPYLNGGLFERDENDEPESKFPAELFRRLFNFFSEYNFTIDENDPNDAEVGVDPEMLGKIFENLLEDNKDKGAFYTPKEIVRYMCQESLIAYLDTATSIAADKIRKFVITPEEGVSDIPENKKGKLLDALKDVKICDPAIGSGAFPMGLLNELLKCREALLGTRTGNGIMETSIKYENEIKNIQPSFPSPYLVPNSRSQIKKDIIQNNIYGVDIEKGAVDIARLRFWLSIVVDEETPSPLPNLDYKIMQGNSLIESYRGLDLSKLTYTKKGSGHITQYSIFEDDTKQEQRRVTELLSQYYSCSDHDKKTDLRNKISNTINKQLSVQNFDADILRELRTLDLAGNDQFFLWHTWFSDVFNREGDKKGFDIVIGNPPYVDYRKIDNITKNGIQKYHTYNIEKKGSLYVYFIEKGLRITKENGVLIFINPYQYLSAESGIGIRDYIIKNHYLESIIDISNIKVFDTANTYTCINTFISNQKQDDIAIYKPQNLNQIRSNISLIKRDEISEKSKFEIIISSNNIISKIEKIKTTLIDHCDIFCGLSKTGFRDYVSTYKINNKYQPFVESKQIERYITNTNKYIDTDIYSAKVYRQFSGECLFMCRMTSRMRVALSYANETGGKINVLYNFKNDKYKLYVLGVLNSNLVNYYYSTKNESKHLNGGALPFDTESVKIIPIPNAADNIISEIAQLVSEIIKNKRNYLPVDNSIECRIDEIVYNLYDLTEEEIKVVEG